MKTCGASGPPIIYTCQFVYNFRFALTSKPREIDLLTCKKKKKKKTVATKNHGHILDFQKSQSKDNSDLLFQSLRVLKKV